MGISSDIYISREEAIKMVTKQLLYDQQLLVKKAVEAMEDDELTSKLNRDSDLYYYNIESEDENE